MLRVLITACAIAFLPVKTVVAQEAFWGAKPVQCGPVESALNIAMDKELIPVFSGMGWANSANAEQSIPVKVGLYMNVQTQEFAVIEYSVDMSEACIVAYGEGIQFTEEDINNFLMGVLTPN